MTILRLKVKRQQEQRINKVKDMLDMYSIKVPGSNYYQYQTIGASAVSNSPAPADPRIQATKRLFRMFGIDR